MQFEKKYWSKDEFTDSSGVPFTGYVGIIDGEAYSYFNNEKLKSNDTYLARINRSNKNFDRALSQKLKLPYNREDVVFAANDFLYAGVIKTAVERLQENNDYLFKNSIISSSKLPAAEECVLLSSAVDSKGNLFGDGKLGKYNFSSYVFDSKTQEDRNFYPDTETRYNYFLKNKSGLKVEKASSDIVFIPGERKEKNDILGDKESIESYWQRLYNNGEKPVLTLKNGEGTIEIDLDLSQEVSEDEYLYYKNYPTASTDISKTYRRSYFSKKLKGPKNLKNLTANENHTLTLLSPYLAGSNKFLLTELSFIIKTDNIVDTSLIINNVSYTPSHYFKLNDNFYHVFYSLTLDEQSEKILSVKFNKDLTIIASDDNIRFDAQFEMGEREDELANCKKISNIIRTSRYRYIWTTNDGINRYSGLNWTYKHLIESEEWITALKNNKNPHLVLSLSGGEEFIPSDSMTAYDIYLLGCEKYGEYSYPKVWRETKYENKGEIYNSNYKEKKYSLETYAIENEEIIFSYKSAEDIYMDLDISNVREQYDKVPLVIKEGYMVTKGEENLLCNFNEIKASDIVIHKVDTVNKCAELLIFLVVKTKVIIFKTKYYYKNISLDTSANGQNFVISDADFIKKDFLINLKEGEDAIHIETINPHDDSSLKFLNLNAIKIYKNAMYLVDSKLDMVMRYDIEALIDKSEASTVNWFKRDSIKLVDIMQGLGDSTDKIYFNNPYSIDVNDDYAYIVDRNNNCIKEYTPALSFIKTLKNGYFASHDVQACAINPHGCTIGEVTISPNSLWIASVQGKRIYISVLENDIVKFYGQLEHIVLLQDENSWLEEIRSIKFSQANSNYLYLNTSKRIYKLHVSNPLYPFASLSYFKQRSTVGTMRWDAMRYPWNKIPSIYGLIPSKARNTEINKNELTWDYQPSTSSAEILDNKCFCLTSAPEIEGDIIFHFGVLYDDSRVKEYMRENKKNFKDNIMTFYDIPIGILANMIKSSAMLLYQEPDNFVSTIGNSFIKIYDIYDINEKIENDYINTLTFNKMLYSLVYNLLKIKNNLIGYFRAATNLDNVIVYDNVIIDEYFNELKLKSHENYFVHNNEHLSIIINKTFENIYDVQEKILNNMQTRFMAAQSFVNNTSRII